MGKQIYFNRKLIQHYFRDLFLMSIIKNKPLAYISQFGNAEASQFSEIQSYSFQSPLYMKPAYFNIRIFD